MLSGKVSVDLESTATVADLKTHARIKMSSIKVSLSDTEENLMAKKVSGCVVETFEL